MCENFECPLRGLCYRYRAIPFEYQSFCFFVPNYKKSSEWSVIDCDYFWDVRGHSYRLEDREKLDEKYKRIPRIVKMAKEKQDD